MTSIYAKDATDAFIQLCNELTRNSELYASRAGTMAELLNVQIEIAHPERRLNVLPIRKFPKKAAAAEFAWYMTHNPKVNLIAKYLSFWQTCSDNGETVNSNYGAIWFKQLPQVIERLRNQLLVEDDTAFVDRRCVIDIHDAKFAFYDGKDMPCTLSVVFELRDNKLNMTTYMRSNDVVRGFCIDVYTWTVLQELIVNQLRSEHFNVELGVYVHNVASMHMYDMHFKSYIDNAQELEQQYEQALRDDAYAASIAETTTLDNYWQACDPYFNLKPEDWNWFRDAISLPYDDAKHEPAKAETKSEPKSTRKINTMW